MIRFFSFKKPQKRHFTYTPRFYDAEKEARAYRLNKANTQEDAIKSRISSQFRDHRARERHGRKLKGLFKRSSSLRLLLILALLIIGAYYAINQYLPLLIKIL